MIENYYSKGDLKHPEISLNVDSGQMFIKGNSIPENAYDLYEPVYSWLEQYKNSPQPVTNFEFHLWHYNSSSLRYIWKIFVVLKDLRDEGNDVEIRWLYDADDPEMADTGIMLKEKTGLSIANIAVDE